jgi:hypothetical protein
MHFAHQQFLLTGVVKAILSTFARFTTMQTIGSQAATLR